MEEEKLEIEDYHKASIKKAWDLYSSDKFEVAEIEVKKLLIQYPENLECSYLLGHIYCALELYQKSVDQYMDALSKDSNAQAAGYIYFWIAEIYGKSSLFDDEAKYIYNVEKSEEYYALAKQTENFPPHLLLRNLHKLKGQDKIDLCEEGIKRFPNNVDFYIILGEEYRRSGLSKLQLNTYERAQSVQLASPSLFYNLGLYFFKASDYTSACVYFEKAIACNENYTYSNFGLNYYLGRAWEMYGDQNKAEVFYLKSYEEDNSSDCLFGFLGLLNLYLDQNNNISVKELVLNFAIKRDFLYLETRVSGGPLHLNDNATDSIEIGNLGAIHQKLSKFKDQSNDNLFTGKLWLVRYLLSVQLSKYNEQYRAVKNAKKLLNSYHFEFLDELHIEAISNLIYYKSETNKDLSKVYEMVINDLDENNKFKIDFIDYLKSIVEKLYEEKEFQKIVTLSDYYSFEELTEKDVIFMTAFSYGEMNDDNKSRSHYEFYLETHNNSTAALNNLGNIYKREGNYAKAIELYTRGLKIDSDNENLKSNLANTLREQAEQEAKFASEKALRKEYRNSTESLKLENDYVLEKLGRFIDQVKKDDDFDNWAIPIAKFKFQKILGVDKQRAESLTTQWLSKGYIVDSGNRNDYNVVIYSINPFIEEELKRIHSYKIPQKWIDGFVNISIESLESNGYFEMIEKIGKVNRKFKALLERDYNELTYNYLMGHQKATIVLSGSLVELALTFYCERKKLMTITVNDSRGNPKNKRLYDCVLSDLIEFVELTRPFGADFIHLSNLSRIYRNFIHPGRELKDSLDKSKADLCYFSTTEILKRII